MGVRTARAGVAQPHLSHPIPSHPIKGLFTEAPLYPIYKSFQHVFVSVTNVTLSSLTLLFTSASVEMLEISFHLHNL